MRRLLGSAAAIAATLFAIAWAFFAALEIFHALKFGPLTLNVAIREAPGPRPDTYDQASHLYYLALSLTPAIALGGLAYCTIVGNSFGRRILVYSALLAILLPINLFNYNQGDMVLSIEVQALLNIVTIFLGIVLVATIWSVQTGSLDTSTVKVIAIAIMLGSTVLAPAFFTMIWAMVAVGILDKEDARSVTWQHITGASALVGAGLAVAKFVLDYRKDQAAKKV